MTNASRPPSRKNRKDDAPYRMPIRLWSTVVIQLHSPVGSACAAGACSSAVVAMSIPLLVGPQVRHHCLHLVIGEGRDNHQRALLPALRILDPLGQVLIIVDQRA